MSSAFASLMGRCSECGGNAGSLRLLERVMSHRLEMTLRSLPPSDAAVKPPSHVDDVAFKLVAHGEPTCLTGSKA